MDSQVVHSHDQGHRLDPNTIALHSAVEGEEHGDHHHEKESVLKKVKAKAKKLKDKIAKHGHGHGHDHDNRQEGHVGPDDHGLDEEDDEDEEMVEDPEVHGAPMYESTAIRNAVTWPVATEEGGNPPSDGNRQHAAGAFEEKGGRLRAEYGETVPVEEGPRAPVNTPQAQAVDQYKVNLTGPGGLEEDPDAPKDKEELYRPSNYQTKVVDPTGSGGNEAEVAPLDESFGAMHIKDQIEAEPTQVYGKSMGSHDQFSPEPVTDETEILFGNPEPVPESDTTTRTEGGAKDDKRSSSSSYTEKISSSATTSAVTDKAVEMKNILTSKLGYAASPEGDVVEEKSGDQSSRQGGYVEKIVSAAHVIADKALSATNLVASKIRGGVIEDRTAQESSGLTEHRGGEPSGQSSYTEKVAAAAESVKDAVASSLSYEKKDGVASHETKQKIVEGSAGETTPATEQGKKVTGQDKGVSVRDYLAEKLKPGEEDKALSEVISSALGKGKKGAEEPAVVTESEGVTRHLGEGSRGEGQLSGPGRATGDKLRGAVGSWLGKSGDSQAPQHSRGSGAIHPGEDTSPPEPQRGERRLQESMSLADQRSKEMFD